MHISPYFFVRGERKMNFYELELKDKVIKLRLTSGKALEIEKKTGVKL